MKYKIIDALEKECEKNTNDMTARVVCNHVVEQLDNVSEEVLKNILDKKLTIKGAVEEMRKAAKKVAVGNCGVLTDEEGFEIVNKYFGLGKAKSVETKQEERKPVSLFDIM